MDKNSKKDLTQLPIEEYEERVAIDVGDITAAQVRAIHWEPLSDDILGGMLRDIDYTTHFMPIIEKAITSMDSYERSNLPMEILRRGVMTKSPFFDDPRHRAAAILYSPLSKGIQRPSKDDIKRLFLDLNMPPFEGDDEAPEHTIPQLLPGLGSMMSSPKWPPSDMNGVREFIQDTMRREFEPITAAITSLEEWLPTIVSDFRVMIVNLRYNLNNNRSLIKHLPSSIKASEESRGKIITPKLIEETFPFEIPVDIPIEEGEAYALYGESGPMIVILDYGYGDNRYLPLMKDRTTATISTGIQPDTLWQLNIVLPESDLRIVETLQHVRFMAFYTRPSLFEEEEVFVGRSLSVKREWEGEDMVEKAIQTGTAYVKSLASDYLDTNDTLGRAYTALYLSELKVGIREDTANGLIPFEVGSKSSKILDKCESSLNRLDKNK